MKLFKNSAGQWFLRDGFIPSGSCYFTYFEPFNEITIKLLNQSTILSCKLTDLQDENGTPYVDLAAFLTACGSFFVNPLNPLEQEVKGLAEKIELMESIALMESLHSYGIIIDDFNSLPAPLARVGNMQLHQTLPCHQFKNCLKKTDDEVEYYCHPNNTALKEDGSAADLTGADGDVMSERDQMWIKFTNHSDMRTEFRVSRVQIPGYTLVPKGYLGVYQASMNRVTGQMRSVVNTTADYRGGNNNVAFDGTDQDFRGKPASLINLTNFRTAARVGRSNRWSPISYFERWIRAYMFYLEYANLNSQAAVVGKNPVTGFMEGGLGAGVTTAVSAEWTAFNAQNPFIPCGVTNSLGNKSGEVSYVAVNFGGASQNRSFAANRYRGVENPFGHLFEWTDGVLVDVKNDADGGTSKLYTTNDPTKFSSDSFADYKYKGLIPRADGYIRQLIQGEIMPKNTVGAGATTYHCDYSYTSVTSSSLRGVLFGGYASYGAIAGLVYSATYYAPSTANASFGSRLCFL